MEAVYRYRQVRCLQLLAALTLPVAYGTRLSGLEGAIGTVAAVVGLLLWLAVIPLAGWLSSRPSIDISRATPVEWPPGDAVTVRRAPRWHGYDLVVPTVAALVAWWFIQLELALADVLPVVCLGLLSLFAWAVERLLPPVLTMDRDGVYEPGTGIRFAWSDVVGVWARQETNGLAMMFLQVADPERVAGQAANTWRGRRAARTIREKSGYEVVVSDRNLSPETIVGLVRTAVPAQASTGPG